MFEIFFVNNGLLDCVTRIVLQTWLATDSLIEFDTSLCSSKCRVLFLHLISDKFFDTYGLKFSRQSFPKLLQSWTLLRSVKIRTLIYRKSNRLCKLDQNIILFSNLIHLDIFVDNFFVELLPICCHRLQSLTLEGDNRSNTVSIGTILSCTKLKLLVLSGTLLFVDDFPYWEVDHDMRLLHLTTFECKVRRGACLLVDAILKHSPNLTTFDILNCRDLTPELLHTVPEYCPRLTCCDLQPNLNTEEMCAYIVSRLPFLQSTNTCVNSTTDSLIHILASHGHQLTYLTLECTTIEVLTQSALTHLGKSCSLLTKLDINYDTDCSDEVMGRLLVCLPALRVLNLELSSSLNTQSLVHFSTLRSTGDEVFSSFDTITDLNLSFCDQLDEEGLLLVARLFPRLQTLDIGGCRLVTNRAVESIACSLLDLHTIVLSTCIGLTDDLFVGLSRDREEESEEHVMLFPSLRHFTAATELVLYVGADIWGMSARSIISLLDVCPGLVSLDMAHNDRMTDEVVRVLAKRCPALERLVLTDDKGNISEECFLSLEEGDFESLKYIDFFYVMNITELSVLHLIRVCSGLETVAIATHNATVGSSRALLECHRVDFYNVNFNMMNDDDNADNAGNVVE